MNSLKWSEGLALDLPLMDQTHMEFVELLQVVDADTLRERELSSLRFG